MFTSNNLDNYFEELRDQLWTLLPIKIDFAAKLLNSAKHKSPQFKAAGISAQAELVPEFRSDSIFWLDKNSSTSSPERELLSQLDELKSKLHSFFRLQLSDVECHYAVYSPGQFYVRHRDITPGYNKRIFSFVIYLNDSWAPEHGGQLRGYRDDQPLFEIEPRMGSMILFRSDLEHEVLKTLSPRYSLTGWIRK